MIKTLNQKDNNPTHSTGVIKKNRKALHIRWKVPQDSTRLLLVPYGIPRGLKTVGVRVQRGPNEYAPRAYPVNKAKR